MRGGSASPAAPPSDGRRRAWAAGRLLAAGLALLVFVTAGLEYRIERRAEAGLQQNRVSALVPAEAPTTSGTTSGSVSAVVSSVATEPDRANSSTAAPQPASSVRYPAENILLLGSDSRAGANTALGGSDQSTTDVANSDVVMIAHLSADRQRVTILSIPRDTMIPAPTTCHTWDADTGKYSTQVYQPDPGDRFHFNSGYSVGGPRCVVTEVQSLTGLHIDRFVGIDFAGFRSMVDALGGVTVDACGPIIDTVLKTVVPRGGVQQVDGTQALALVRARHVIGEGGSDLARIRRQQIVLSAILRQVTAAGTLLNPSKLDNFLQAFTKNTFTDNVTMDDLVGLAESLDNLNPGRVTFYTLPTYPSPTVDGALEVSQPAAAALFAAMAHDQEPPAPSGAAASRPPTGPAGALPSTPGALAAPLGGTSAGATARPGSPPPASPGPTTARSATPRATPRPASPRPAPPRPATSSSSSAVQSVNAATRACVGPSASP